MGKKVKYSLDDPYSCDVARYGGEAKPPRFIYHMRKIQSKLSKPMFYYHWFWYKFWSFMYKNDIHYKAEIGPGLYVGHPYCITVTPFAKIGKNCNIHKGAVVGAENRGKRKGAPTIGDNVFIGINAIVVGNITIGEDVMISPGAFVNFDVPAHSVVTGNPGIIKPRDNATDAYIGFRID